jgi:hypothetical protein
MASVKCSRSLVVLQRIANVRMLARLHLLSFGQRLFRIFCMSFQSLATRSWCADQRRSAFCANAAQQCACMAASSVQVVSLAQSSRQLARASNFVSAFKCAIPGVLALSLLTASSVKQSPCQRRPANFVPSDRSNSRANVSPAIRVPTQCQQFACQRVASNSRANSGGPQQRQPTLRPMPSARAPLPRPALLLLLSYSSGYGAIPAIAEPRPTFGFR